MINFKNMLKNRYPLRMQIAGLFGLLIITTGVVIIILNHYQLTKLTEINTTKQYRKIGTAIAAKIDAILRPIIISTNIFSSIPVDEYNTAQQRAISLDRMTDILKINTHASSVYYAYANGDLFLLRSITDANRPFLQAPDDAQWLIQSIEHHQQEVLKQFIFLNSDKQAIKTIVPENYDFDPREREWYKSALATSGLVTSPIYVFKLTQESGITFSQKVKGQNVVVGLDLSLNSLSQFMHQQNLPSNSQAIIISQWDDVIASLDPKDITDTTHHIEEGGQRILHIKNTVLSTLMNKWNELKSRNDSVPSDGTGILFYAGQQRWYGSVLSMNNENNHFQLAIATQYSDLTAYADRISNQSTLVTAILLLLCIPIVWIFSLKISHPLIKLRKDADAISNFYFDDQTNVPSAVEEIDELNQSMAKMKTTIKHFISIGHMLSTAKDFVLQMQGLLKETINIATMSGGLIFLSNKEGQIFTPFAFRWNHENLSINDSSELTIDEITFSGFASILQGNTISGHLHEDNVHGQLKVFLFDHLPLRYVAVPMQNQGGHILGFMLLLSPDELTIEKENAKIQLVNALVGGLSVSVETQRLLQEQKNLLNAFIELIAGAIDAKSEYTGGHCQRVPEITKMLAQAAVDTQEGPFASFTLNPDEWEELHIACWLHDCGKITTPEFIVDKATKLEMIYNRVHEIRMRFEVLKREEEIAFLRQHGPLPDNDPAWQTLKTRLKSLDDDFYFIAECNVSSEKHLPDESVTRINQIAHHQWTRTLNDRTGIAHEEHARKSRTPEEVLPVKEPILADKEDHIIYRDKRNKLPKGFKFKIKEPLYLYNHGEIHNLTIRRGTLTEEDRYKINEHIMQTIMMLKKLPFPYTMTNVPEIAGGHHERVDGKGYPYQLTRDQMSIQVRMLAIADVFEALTATDRPYKMANTLTEALNIMINMVNNHHLDRQLFILFLESGVLQRYANIYLQSALIDHIDVPALLAKIKPE